jgi:hypothetical protein
VGDRKSQIGTIDAHQRLPSMDEYAGVHQTLDDFTGYSEAQIALYPRSNHIGEGELRGTRRLNGCHLHKLNAGPWIRFMRRFAGGEAERCDCESQCKGESLQSRLPHRYRVIPVSRLRSQTFDPPCHQIIVVIFMMVVMIA